MIKIILSLVWALGGNFIHATLLALPLWWALNRLGNFVGMSVSYFDALAVALTVWAIGCAWEGVKTDLKFKM